MTMKWKRKKPGHYVSGDWEIEGAGRKWELRCYGEHAGFSDSYENAKKAIERKAVHGTKRSEVAAAEAEEEETVELAEETELEKAVVTGRGTIPLDSSLRSLRLSIDSIAMSLSSAVAVLSDIKERLTSLENKRGKR